MLRSEPPTGEAWLHEIKFDGCRAQLHKDGDEIALYPKSGKDFPARFKGIARALEWLPVRRVITDAEIVACDSEGRPDFRALHSGAKEGLCAWCFDLLALDERDITNLPLVQRRNLLAPAVKKAANSALRYSEALPIRWHC